MLNKVIFTIAGTYALFMVNIVTVFGHEGYIHVLPGNTAPAQYDTQLRHMSEASRIRSLQPDRVVDALDIKPGMTILDMGAGSGVFSFRFAKALNGTGRVYATDVIPHMVEYLEREAEQSAVENVTPVLVNGRGLDPFYEQHTFDIIFLCSVYYYIHRPEEFFRALRPSFKKGGRVFIIQPKIDGDFNEDMFSNFQDVIRIFVKEGKSFPVFQRLGEQPQNFIMHWQVNSDVPPEIRSEIVQDFNMMLQDRFLVNDLLDYYYSNGAATPWTFIAEQESFKPSFALIKWLFGEMEEEGVFSKDQKKISDINKKRLFKLNRILLNGIFKPLRWYWQGGSYVMVGKKSIITTLNKAGYKFVREFSFLSGDYFLEFANNKE